MRTSARSGTRVTESPSETGGSAVEEFAARIAEAIGSDDWVVEHDTPRIYVDRSDWTEAIRKARDAGLPFFSWLSAIDWSREVAVGDPVEDVDALDERFEVVCRLSSVENWEGAHLIATLPKDDPTIDSLVPLFGGAAWHERETAEMYGIDFKGHPHLVNLYLPNEFEGNPLKKSYALLAREVKPWPGTVDVEAMPEIPDEAGAAGSAGEDAGDDS
jgi:NADH-quinone oxidoreductase subunit C